MLQRFVLLVALLAGCASEPPTTEDRPPGRGADGAERVAGAAASARVEAGPPSAKELRRRLVAAGRAGELPVALDDAAAETIEAAMAALGRARRAARDGTLDRAGLDAARASAEATCLEASGLGCDALLFTPRSRP